MSESNGIALAQKILGARELPGESDPALTDHGNYEDPFSHPSINAQRPSTSSLEQDERPTYGSGTSSYPTGRMHHELVEIQQKAEAKLREMVEQEKAEKEAAAAARRAALAAAEPKVFTEDIHGFDKGTDTFFLSNFAPSPVYINFHGVVIMLPTGEHVFQAMKAAAMLDRSKQAQIAYVVAMSKAPTPGKAKHLGRSVRIDPKRWDAMAINCMKRTVELKFSQNPDLRKALLATGKVKLVEENDWGDKLWGTVNGEGRNELGKILMSYRNSIKRY